MAQQVDIQSTDVVRLIQQFLLEANLPAALAALQEESGVALNTVPSLDTLLSAVVAGDWAQALPLLNALRLPRDKCCDVYEQVVLELLELRELEAARALVDDAPALLALREDHPARAARLEHLLARDVWVETEAYEVGENKQTRRERIAQSLVGEVTQVEPGRLLALLGQALKYQQAQGLLPAGAKFDLFRGAQPVTADAVETFPTGLHRSIKFPKGSHAHVAAFAPGGQLLLSGSTDGFIEAWNVDTGKLDKDLAYQAAEEFMIMDDAVLALAFSPDGHTLASGSKDGRIKTWELATGKVLRRFDSAHTGAVTCIQLNGDASLVLSGSVDGTVRMHGQKAGQLLKEFRGHASFVNAVAFSTSERRIISGSADATVRVWDARSSECLATFRPGHDLGLASDAGVHTILRVPSSPDELLVGTASNRLFIVAEDGRTVRHMTAPRSADFAACSVSPKGAWVYAVGQDSTLHCFSMLSGEQEHMMKLSDGGATLGLAHHPTRNLLASYTSQPGRIGIWAPQ